MSLTSMLYSGAFKRSSSMIAIVFGAGFAWEIGFNRGMDSLWDHWNKGRQWKDIRHKYVEDAGDDE